MDFLHDMIINIYWRVCSAWYAAGYIAADQSGKERNGYFIAFWFWGRDDTSMRDLFYMVDCWSSIIIRGSKGHI